MENFRKVWPYLKPYRRLAVVSLSLLVLGAAAALLAPWPLQILFDNVLQQRPLPPALAAVLGPLADSRTALFAAAITGGVLVTLVQHGLTVLDNYVNTKIEQSMVL